MKNILFYFILCCCLSGCFLQPHVPNIQQGNIVDKATITSLKNGMSKDEVKALLGEPVLVDAFDQNCWSYAYTNQINGGKITKQTVNLYFSDDKLTNVQNIYPTSK